MKPNSNGGVAGQPSRLHFYGFFPTAIAAFIGIKEIGNFLPSDHLKLHCVGPYRSVLVGRKEIGNFLLSDPLKSHCAPLPYVHACTMNSRVIVAVC